MAANFNLYLLSDSEKKPLRLIDVDEMICQHFGAEVHPTNWHHGWYDSIGYNLANGKNFDQQIANNIKEIEEHYKDNLEMIEYIKYENKIIEFMKQTFGFNNWYSWGKT